jgi:amino acid transporter
MTGADIRVGDVPVEVSGDLHVRRKSGLVRAAGPYEAFIFALAAISVGIMVSWGAYFGTGFYPGAHAVLAIVISAIVALPIAFAYQYWGQIFPRSGGDYVFLSRTLPPGIAFGLNFVFVVMVAASPAFAMSIMQPLWQSGATALGAIVHWHWLQISAASWFTTNLGFAVVGTVPVVVAGLVGLYGLRAQISLLKVLFVVGLIGGLVLIVALLATPSSQFASHLKAQTGLTAAGVQSSASHNGFVYGGSSFSHTLKLTNWYAASLFFVLVLTYIGGEIKSVRTSMRIGMSGAIVFSAAMTILFIVALDHAVPGKLQGALAYNSLVVPTASTPSPPYAHELFAILWGTSGAGLILTLIAIATMLAWVSIWWASLVPFAQRAILAWSLDGVIPAWFNKVTDRNHTPIGALAAAVALVEAWILAFAFVPSLRTIVLLAPIYVLIAVTMVIGVVFPFVRPQFFRQSVVARARIGPVPMMSVACLLAAVVLGLWTWLLLSDPIASGTKRGQIWIAAGVAVAVAIYYVLLRAYRRRSGIDIDATFKEIPIE